MRFLVEHSRICLLQQSNHLLYPHPPSRSLRHWFSMGRCYYVQVQAGSNGLDPLPPPPFFFRGKKNICVILLNRISSLRD